MEQGLVTIPLVPIRTEPSERSEMTTQLLFGERFELLRKENNWCLVRNLTDGYEGWGTEKMLSIPPESLLNRWDRYQKVRVRMPFATCITHEHEEQYLLPAGSLLCMTGDTPASVVFPRLEDGQWVWKECTVLRYEETLAPTSCSDILAEIIRTTQLFEHAPYLWGGKSYLGIDCSGLVQLVASIHGFLLPRDAKDQARLGESVHMYEAGKGDLAFFRNPEGRIVHVGLLLSNHRILHASGTVHIDAFDEQGIFSRDLNCYTHQLASIRRIFVP